MYRLRFIPDLDPISLPSLPLVLNSDALSSREDTFAPARYTALPPTSDDV